jgi:hypothetical protein
MSTLLLEEKNKFVNESPFILMSLMHEQIDTHMLASD